MLIKRIHILAKSAKNHEHCIAGREVIEHQGSLSFGQWIRPVSHHGKGELNWQDCRFSDGSSPSVLDVVDVPLERHEGSACQPENWFIHPGTPWRRAKIRGVLPPLEVDSPRDLWRVAGERGDRISLAGLEHLRCGHSLYLIGAKKFKMELGWKYDAEIPTRRRRAIFEYNGFPYDFSLTDPVIQDKYCRGHPRPEDPEKTIRLPSGGDCILCVSLTPPFNGYHYKIVATVIEQQP